MLRLALPAVKQVRNFTSEFKVISSGWKRLHSTLANVVPSPYEDCVLPNTTVVQRFFETADQWPTNVAMVCLHFLCLWPVLTSRFVEGMRHHGPKVHLRTIANHDPPIWKCFAANGFPTRRNFWNAFAQHSWISGDSVGRFRHRHASGSHQPELSGRYESFDCLFGKEKWNGSRFYRGNCTAVSQISSQSHRRSVGHGRNVEPCQSIVPVRPSTHIDRRIRRRIRFHRGHASRSWRSLQWKYRCNDRLITKGKF